MLTVFIGFLVGLIGFVFVAIDNKKHGHARYGPADVFAALSLGGIFGVIGAIVIGWFAPKEQVVVHSGRLFPLQPGIFLEIKDSRIAYLGKGISEGKAEGRSTMSNIQIVEELRQDGEIRTLEERLSRRGWLWRFAFYDSNSLVTEFRVPVGSVLRIKRTSPSQVSGVARQGHLPHF